MPTLVADGNGQDTDAVTAVRAVAHRPGRLERPDRPSAGGALGRRDSSASRSPGRSSASRGCCSATSRPATSIRLRPRRVASLLLDLHRRLNNILVVVTHSARLATLFPSRFDLVDRQLHRLVRRGGRRREGILDPMTATRLALRGLFYYWRTNGAVVIGVATAVAVLSGALLVGDSVRGSLRDLVLQRLGRTDFVVASSGFFRDQLADDARARCGIQRALRRRRAAHRRWPAWSPTRTRRAAPATSASTAWTIDSGGFTAGRGVAGPRRGDALISPGLAAAIGARRAAPSSCACSVRRRCRSNRCTDARTTSAARCGLTVDRVLPASDMGEFSLEAQQGDVRAVFLPLSALQQALGGRRPREHRPRGRRIRRAGSGRAGAGGAKRGTPRGSRPHGARDRCPAGRQRRVRRRADRRPHGGSRGPGHPGHGRVGPAGAHLSGQHDPRQRARDPLLAGHRDRPPHDRAGRSGVLRGSAATNRPERLGRPGAAGAPRRPRDARLLRLGGAGPAGDALRRTSGRRPVVPIDAGDRDLAPVYPGITDSPIARATGIRRFPWTCGASAPSTKSTGSSTARRRRRSCRSRPGSGCGDRATVSSHPSGCRWPRTSPRRRRASGSRTALRSGPRSNRLRASRRAACGPRRSPPRAARPTSAQYFVYFSFFLVVSALLLAALFFKLGVEQRAREVGLLRVGGIRSGGGAPAVPRGRRDARRRGQRGGCARRHRLRRATDGGAARPGGSMPWARPRSPCTSPGGRLRAAPSAA